ncbi:MAG: hypothetical protein AAFR52_17905 [Pseudomonadota bacterium]
MRIEALTGAALALALLAAPAAAQQQEAEQAPINPALARALASVNEGDEDQPRARAADPGFFGRGFFVTTDTVAPEVGGDRFGFRREGREGNGRRLYSR